MYLGHHLESKLNTVGGVNRGHYLSATVTRIERRSKDCDCTSNASSWIKRGTGREIVVLPRRVGYRRIQQGKLRASRDSQGILKVSQSEIYRYLSEEG
jgi:hypothetical protein